MKYTTANHGKIPLDPEKLIQFLTTPEMWDKDRGRGNDFDGWYEAYQLLVTKIRNGDFTIPLPNSTEMIGKPNDRFKILSENPHHNLTKSDYSAWYSGWIDGRFELYSKVFKWSRK